MSTQTTPVGAVNPYMYQMPSSNYMYPMGGLMDDVLARNLYYQMQSPSYQVPYSMPQIGYYNQGYVAPNAGVGTPAPTGKKGVNPLAGGLIAGGATYAGARFLDFQFNSPINPEKPGQFAEPYLNHISGEYAAVKNGQELENFFKTRGVEPVNFEATMSDLKLLATESDAKILEYATNNKELAEMLKKGGIITENAGKLELVTGKGIVDVRDLYSKTSEEFRNINLKNNYLGNKQFMETLAELEKSKAWDACKTPELKLDFLRRNANELGLNSDEIRKIMFENPTEAELTQIFNRADIATRKATLETTMNGVKNDINGLSKYWQKGKNIFNPSSFHATGLESNGKGLTEVCKNGLRAFRRGKAWPIALIAAVGTAIICACTGKKQ